MPRTAGGMRRLAVDEQTSAAAAMAMESRYGRRNGASDRNGRSERLLPRGAATRATWFANSSPDCAIGTPAALPTANIGLLRARPNGAYRRAGLPARNGSSISARFREFPGFPP